MLFLRRYNNRAVNWDVTSILGLIPRRSPQLSTVGSYTVRVTTRMDSSKQVGCAYALVTWVQSEW